MSSRARAKPWFSGGAEMLAAMSVRLDVLEAEGAVWSEGRFLHTSWNHPFVFPYREFLEAIEREASQPYRPPGPLIVSPADLERLRQIAMESTRHSTMELSTSGPLSFMGIPLLAGAYVRK